MTAAKSKFNELGTAESNRHSYAGLKLKISSSPAACHVGGLTGGAIDNVLYCIEIGFGRRATFSCHWEEATGLVVRWPWFAELFYGAVCTPVTAWRPSPLSAGPHIPSEQELEGRLESRVSEQTNKQAN